jgi:hypothetical protein
VARAGIGKIPSAKLPRSWVQRWKKKVSFHGNSPASPDPGLRPSPSTHRIFLLSPANLRGIRGQRLLNAESRSELGQRLRTGGAPLAELFCHVSSLYFRGKLTYARLFAAPPPGLEGCYIITSSRGLLSPDTVADVEAVRELSAVARLDSEDDRYRIPLQRDAAALKTLLSDTSQVVLLGSLATEKYVKPLLEVFGAQLVFPSAFVGRGDMSRGGLLLRCVREKRELTYVPALGSWHDTKRGSKQVGSERKDTSFY